MTTQQYITEAFEKNPYYSFTDKQMAELTGLIEEREIAKSYNEAFITYHEGINMILHHASEIANKTPNKGAFPKPPQASE